jgi:PIN domain nuclease of toxin-antitoxin system
VNLLLDTHVALWAITDDPRLSDAARELILAPEATVWVSVASLWEIAIKHALGRGNMPVSGGEARSYFREAGYRVLDIRAEHAVAVEQLPPLHADPFDRLLLAQAMVEPMRLLNRDRQIVAYGGTVVEV